MKNYPKITFPHQYFTKKVLLTAHIWDDLYAGDRSKNFILWKVSWGQYKNKLLIWLFSAEPNSWDMAQNVKIGLKMKTEKTEKRWYFLKDDDHRWLFDNQSVGDCYWKTAKTGHFVSQVCFSHCALYEKSQKPRRIFYEVIS